MYADRVLSGMRPTGSLHLGHYHGVLKNWIKLQHEYECLFFVADWHALTTHYDNPLGIEDAPGRWSSTGWPPASTRARPPCSSSRRSSSTPNCTCCCR
jgi:hypothetical protein